MSGVVINRDVQVKHIPVVVNAINKINRVINNDINIKSFSFDIRFDDSIVSFDGGGSYFNEYNRSVYRQLIEANYDKVVTQICVIEGIKDDANPETPPVKIPIPRYDGNGNIDDITTLPTDSDDKNDVLDSITLYILNHIDSVDWSIVLCNEKSPYYNPTSKPDQVPRFVNFCPLLRLHGKANDPDMNDVRNIIFNSKTILSMHIHRDQFIYDGEIVVNEYSRRLGFLSSSANTKYPDIYFNVASLSYVLPAPVMLYNGDCNKPDWYMTIDPTASFLYPHHQTSLLGHTVRCTIYYI